MYELVTLDGQYEVPVPNKIILLLLDNSRVEKNYNPAKLILKSKTWKKLRRSSVVLRGTRRHLSNWIYKESVGKVERQVAQEQ